MRSFTVYGESALGNLRRFFERNKERKLLFFIVFILSLIPLNFLITAISEEGNWVTSSFLILLSIVAVVANIFRGIKQHDENYKAAVISINIEAIGRVVLGFLFAVTFKWGISGILIGHALGLAGSLLVCFDWKYLKEELTVNDELSLRVALFTTAMMTLGLEFISNFDIIFSNYILKAADQAQTEFNTLQFFRKIIFFGIFAVSSVILSFSSKNKQTKKFSFFFTLFTGLIIGVGLGGFFYLIKGIIFSSLKQEITLISPSSQIVFLVATTLMSTSYLLSNWLFTLKKKVFIYLPLFVSAIQVMIFLFTGKDLFTLLNAFLITSVFFFIVTFSFGIFEIIGEKSESEAANYA
jgi:hypothetical protein